MLAFVREKSVAGHSLFKKLMCVGVVVSALLPLGWMIYPHVADIVSGGLFNTIEAMLGASLGLGLYATIFN